MATRGGYDTVRNAVRPLRAEAAVAALTQRRFETEPGEQAQVDWGQVRVRFVTGPVDVHVFVLTLGYSRRAWAEGYENERMGALLAAHEHAFAHFGGRTAEIALRPDAHGDVAARRGQGALEPDLRGVRPALGLRAAAVPPLPGADQGQGRVRGEVREAQLPARAGVPRSGRLQRRSCVAWLAEVADVRVHGTTHERPIERFAREAGALVRTRDQPSFFQALRRERVVADDWLVSIDANRYSVPWRLIGKTVQVVRVGASWQISHRGAGRGRAPGARRAPSAAGRSRAWTRRRGAQCAHPLRRERAAGERPRAHGLHGVEVRDLAVYEQLLEVA